LEQRASTTRQARSEGFFIGVCNMHRGYIKVYRKIASNPLWMQKPFSDGQAWLDMLLIANYKTGYITKRGARIIVERGQIGTSIKGLADRWGWSRGKVNRFIKHLENEHQIKQQISNVTTLITLLNYEEYNGDEHQNGHQTDTKRTPNGHKQEGKEGLEEVVIETDTKMNLTEAVDLYRRTFSKIDVNSMIMADLKSIIEIFPPNEIKEAFQNSVRAGASSLKYTLTILQSGLDKKEKTKETKKSTYSEGLDAFSSEDNDD
jgi:DNA replication protein DnaD